MDFILKKINSIIDVSDSKTVQKQTLLRERIEYMLFSLLGYLWNKNIDDINVESRSRIIENLDKMSIGEVVAAIRQLDIKKEVISKAGIKIINTYPKLRNSALGHGYTHDDLEDKLEDDLQEMYDELVERIDYFRDVCDIIQITKHTDGKYIGIRYGYDNGGLPSKWSCPDNLIDCTNSINSIMALYNDKYIRLSPFIYIENNGYDIYVFQSLLEKLSGNVNMSRLINSGNKQIEFKELIEISSNSERRRISSNKTIMNYFEPNYTRFIPVDIEQEIINFLFNNRANVLSTIWGHGGVGKTACIQSICMNLFNDLERKFNYIIFLSAKDRMLDPKSGKIIEIKNLRTFRELIMGIASVLYNEDINADGFKVEEYQEKIYEGNAKVLLVIDDYETFPDDEKAKIQKFISNLNIDYYRVIITTRNKRLSSGINISTNELDFKQTKKFLLSIFENDYKEHYDDIKKIIEDGEVMSKIHEATSGRAIFLYQFANLYVQKGYKEDLLSKLKDSKNAQEFLYGKIYSYLSPQAKKAFMAISQITNEEDYIFKGRVLEYLLAEDDNEDSTLAIEELIDQKVIEQYDRENYRVYSKELYLMMKNMYREEGGTYKDIIKSRLSDIGGSNVKGTIYEAMLNEANLSRTKGNAKETVEKYRRLLNDKKCEKRVKKKALTNLTSYMNIDLMNLDGAISCIEEFYVRSSLETDIDIIKIYVQLLWASDNKCRQKACDILERYFKDSAHKKTAYRNLEIFSLAVRYCINNVLNTTFDQERAEVFSKKQRLFNEYGKPLFEYVRERQLSEFKPAVKHNFSIALIQTAYLCIQLGKNDYCESILQYGKNNFNEIFKPSLNKVETQILESVPYTEDRKMNVGEKVSAKIKRIMPYGAIVLIDGKYKALLHISQIMDKYITNVHSVLNIDDTIQVKIISIDQKGIKVSMM